jgi:drug/metabolite transporter (DMT)-like permease
MTQGRRLPILMTLGSGLLWASSFTVVKVGLRYLDPYSFVFLRFVAATAILVAVVAGRGQWREFLVCARDRYVFLLGVTLAASYGFQFVGQDLTTAARAVIIVNSSTILVAPLSRVFLKERMGSRKLVALGLGLIGVCLITGGGRGAGGAGMLRGDLLVAGSAVAYALYVIFSKVTVTRRAHREGPLIAGIFLWSLPVFTVMSLPAFARGVEVSGDAWTAIVYLAVFCSILPFIIWTAAIRHIGALTSAIVLLAELVFGVVIACLFLGETLSAGAVTGCVMISAAILIVGVRS